ncbi:MAG: adenine phosphoribosyltransferase [Gemmatimonadetes bacterium]|nr:adenine phosphoribosyltransferase [Gemmatimonadota bacterium]
MARTKVKGLDAIYGAIRDIPDFPKPGILFRDITPLLKEPKLLKRVIREMAGPFENRPVDSVLAIESRGFILGAPIALALGASLVLARKPGKLPWKRHRVEYELEYGTDAIEIHQDAIEAGDRVLVVDDVLATGGTAAAALRVVEQAGGRLVGVSFLIELTALEGRKRLGGTKVRSLLTYPRSA